MQFKFAHKEKEMKHESKAHEKKESKKHEASESKEEEKEEHQGGGGYGGGNYKGKCPVCGKMNCKEHGMGGGMEKTMHEFKEGKLHSGSKKGPVVQSRKQAIAIGMNS